ncbi:hypothetical protein ACSTIZ_00430, partial [Vibrio parahaemolyticus]
SDDGLKAKLSEVDTYNMQRFLTNNAEWTSREDLRKPQTMFHDFFHSKGNLFEVNTKDFYIQANPMINTQTGQENGYDKPLFQNTRG